ncbi:hypothetical protein F52700_5030 [Fusarium sp. NRRL 52700]|nr:hypothetical protein F52700_5030 [Fusarium sp. NRRL 52700]
MSNNSNGTVAFHVPKTSSLYADPDLYGKIGQAGRIMTCEHVLPPRSGHAFEVPAGSIFRILTPEGPQVGDLNIWNLHDPRERMWTARSRQLYEAHLTIGDRLVSNLPYIRPLATIVGDSLQHIRNNGSWGVHDILGTRCDPYVNMLLGGDSFDYHCHSNLVRSVIPFGLTEHDVHDNINLFQITDINENGQYRLHPCPAKAGDYIEFFAEIDLLVALSACSGGDLTEFGWMTMEMKEAAGSDDKMQNTCT